MVAFFGMKWIYHYWLKSELLVKIKVRMKALTKAIPYNMIAIADKSYRN